MKEELSAAVSGEPPYRQQNFRRLGQEIKADLNILLQQHEEIIKAEGIPSLRTMMGGLLAFCFCLLLFSLVLLRLVDAGVASLGDSWGWAPALRPLAAAFVLLLLAAGCIFISRNLLRRSGHGMKIIVNEMKEDYQWLKNIL